MLPNGFTLASLFFGIYAIVSASRGEHNRATWCIVIAGFCDAVDGRIARATNTGTPFGEELDSLVDAISFGLAPALIMYFAVLRHSGWDWIWVFLFAACAVMRLARFNVEQVGEPKRAYFTGLPSPAAGGTLATYYWFSQTPLYTEFFADWPWETIMRILMATLGFLMISNVPYPAWPKFSFRTLHGTIGIIVLFSGLLAAVDILVHSAGSILLKPFEATTDDEFDAQLRINARSPFILTRALLPCLRNRQGQVVFINSSASQQKARSHQSAYAASKFALTAIADSLRDEVNDAGVRVLSVFPGRTATPMQESVFEFEQREYCGERLLQPEDVAESVVSALSLPRTAEVTDLHLRPFRRH
jgi:CDP-diacylglycerol--serine O-phosphatidyltransferase